MNDKELIDALKEAVASLEWSAMIIQDIPENSHFMQTIADAKEIIAKHPQKEWVPIPEHRIMEIWNEQWEAHAGAWADEFVCNLGKAYNEELRKLNS